MQIGLLCACIIKRLYSQRYAVQGNCFSKLFNLDIHQCGLSSDWLMFKFQAFNKWRGCFNDSHGLPFLYDSWGPLRFYIFIEFSVIDHCGYRNYDIEHICCVCLAALRLEWNSYCVLLWNCHVTLYMLQRDRTF